MSIWGQFNARSGSVVDPWDYQEPASNLPGPCRSIPITDEIRAADAAQQEPGAARGLIFRPTRPDSREAKATGQRLRRGVVCARALGRGRYNSRVPLRYLEMSEVRIQATIIAAVEQP
jgi:hypothetical protein